MSATIDRRLKALERRASSRANQPRLILVCRVDKDDGDIVGIRVGWPHVRHDVARLAGETVEALKARATTLAQGDGPLVTLALY